MTALGIQNDSIWWFGMIIFGVRYDSGGVRNDRIGGLECN